MNSEAAGVPPDQDLVRFACRLLENRGAALEKTEGGMDVLLPPDLARTLGTGDDLRIVWGQQPPGDSSSGQVHGLHYGSPLLERMIQAASDHVPLLLCTLHFTYVKTQGFDRLIQGSFHLTGSRGAVQSWAKANGEYVFLTCRYTAQSDEHKEGLFQLVYNAETGAYVPDMSGLLQTTDRQFEEAGRSAPLAKQRLQRMAGWVKRHVEAHLAEELGPFEQSMTRRLHRDLKNLEEYYAGLGQEMERSLSRAGLSDTLVEERKSKIALLPEELARKKDDLLKKYGIRVRVEPCALLLVRTPVVKVLYKASIGRNDKTLSFTYNPVTKSMDPLVCEGCGESTASVFFCGQQHLLCSACSSACPLC